MRKAFTKGYRSSLAVGALLVHDKCTRSVCICARVHACVRKWRKEYAHVIQSKGEGWLLSYLKLPHNETLSVAVATFSFNTISVEFVNMDNLKSYD